MRVRHAAFLFFAATLLVCAPSGVSAETVIDADIFEDTTWTIEGSPYLVQSDVAVGTNAVLSIGPGVTVQFDSGGQLNVLGSLHVAGTADEPITFTSLAGSSWYGIEFSNPEIASSLDHTIFRNFNKRASAITDLYSKELSISNTEVEGFYYGIEAYGSRLFLDTFSAHNIPGEAIIIEEGSDVVLKNVTLADVNEGVDVSIDSKADISNLLIDRAEGNALVVYFGSRVRVASSTMINGQDDEIVVFNDSSADISNLTSNALSGGEAFVIFNNSKVTLRDSLISHTDSDAIVVFNSGYLTAKNVKLMDGTGDGIAIFAGGFVDMQDSVISGFASGVGIGDYGHREGQLANALSLVRNEITKNSIGVGLYADDSTYVISHNSIHNNTLYGLESYGISAADVSNNYWGDTSGPHSDPDNLAGNGNSIYRDASAGAVTFSPWITSDPLAPDPCATPGACASNVLFLPGIEGSRLYEGTGCGKDAEEKLWEPIGESLLKILRGAGDEKVKSLFLDENGDSVCGDIYAKEGDIIDSVKGSTIYQSFIDEMNGLQSDGTINDWSPVAYDWRLSLDDLLTQGAEREGRIYYNEATSTPYIEQTLRALAAGSKTGKVTIVAHSNGGLVAKVLMQKLGNGPSSLVDKVVMVGVPQSGAPVGVGALLYGYDQGISFWGVPILHSAVAQDLAENSPMAYHLLPSQSYFDSVMDDPSHPVASFAGDGYASELAAYGNALGTWSELGDFIRAFDLNAPLIDYAGSTHAALDSWTPPEGVEVSQVAGWGADTVAGIDFYTPQLADALTALAPARAYRPIFTEDGDGTVPVPSALMMPESAGVKRYWVDLGLYYKETDVKIEHKDIFEIPQLENFIKNIIQNSTSTLPAYISASQPPSTNDKKLTFFLHSPLTLELTDSSGNVTGLAEDGAMTEDIPGSTYGEFGEVKYVTVPADGDYELTMHGQDTGTFSLDIQETSGGVIIASSTIASVPTTASTLASLTISGGFDTTSPLTVDENGDGEEVISITPMVGETVVYSPAPILAPEPEPVAAVVKRSGGRRALVPVAPVTPAVVESVVAVVKPEVAIPAVLVHVQESPAPVKVTVNKPREVVAPPQQETLDIPQTASAYDASQQPVVKKWGSAVYNGWYRFWTALKKLF